MNDNEIPAEAVEAARAEAARQGLLPEHRDISPYDTFIAGYLAASQHVSPSVEDVARRLWVHWNPSGPKWHETNDRSRQEARAEATLVLALLSSQRTVEQVRRETLLRAADDLDQTRGVASGAMIRWLRARAAEEVDRG